MHILIYKVLPFVGVKLCAYGKDYISAQSAYDWFDKFGILQGENMLTQHEGQKIKWSNIKKKSHLSRFTLFATQESSRRTQQTTESFKPLEGSNTKRIGLYILVSIQSTNVNVYTYLMLCIICYIQFLLLLILCNHQIKQCVFFCSHIRNIHTCSGKQTTAIQRRNIVQYNQWLRSPLL